MTAPMRPPRVLRPADPEEQTLLSEQRRLREFEGLKLEDALDKEAKQMLALHFDKPADRINRFKAIAIFIAIKNKLPAPFGGNLNDPPEPSA